MAEGKLGQFLMDDPISLEYFCESATVGSLIREDTGQER